MTRGSGFQFVRPIGFAVFSSPARLGRSKALPVRHQHSLSEYWPTRPGHPQVPADPWPLGRYAARGGIAQAGLVTASLFIAKLQSFRRQNVLTRALQEYGRLHKTIFILRYLLDELFQRRIGAQINKGEALHALRGFLFVANEGKIRHHYDEEQLNQVSCLNLVNNAVVLWNTVYMSAVLDQLRSEGHNVDGVDVMHLSPARYTHINPYGKYRFNVEGEFNRKGLRPLRQPDPVLRGQR
jgi:rRNA maturation protein Nop10